MKKSLLIIFFLFSITAFSQEITKCTSKNTNFRSEAHFGDNIIDLIPQGTCITADKTFFEGYTWLSVEYKNQNGYIHASLLIDKGVYLDKSSKSYIDYNSTNSNVKYYKNVDGKKIQSPTYYSSTPAGATAICNDGTYSFSQHRKGTCSHHGGVRQWLK